MLFTLLVWLIDLFLFFFFPPSSERDIAATDFRAAPVGVVSSGAVIITQNSSPEFV